MNLHKILFLTVICVLSNSITSSVHAAPITLREYESKPKLVLVVVFDQFRADYLTRFSKRFLAPGNAQNPGGFNYLRQKGAYFPFAQYDVLQNMTGPGHATILSGSYPYQTGISTNYWYDQKTSESVYCVNDPEFGISPRNFFGTTVGDELKNAGWPSHVVSIALKDRAAVLLGGHRPNLALWFDPKKFEWTTSPYYSRTSPLPDWVGELNLEISSQKGQSLKWTPSGNSSGLSRPAVGTFEHDTSIGTHESIEAPYGIKLTTEAAQKAMTAFRLGKGDATDLLAISYSTHDYVGHHYGPNSLEMEEITVAEDRSLSELLRSVAKQVPGGLSNVLIVLTADHGMAPNQDWIRAGGMDAGTFDPKEIQALLNSALNDKYGTPSASATPPQGAWVPAMIDLNIYLNHAALLAKKINPSEAEDLIKDKLKALPGVAFLFSHSDFIAHRLPPGILKREIEKGYSPERSGDVVIIPKPFYVQAGDPHAHMTGYSYDRSVPLIFAGSKIRPGVYSERAEIVDIAPTLSFFLGTLSPVMSEGRVLNEMIQKTASSSSTD